MTMTHLHQVNMPILRVNMAIEAFLFSLPSVLLVVLLIYFADQAEEMSGLSPNDVFFEYFGLASKDILNHSFKQSRCADCSPHEFACWLSLSGQTPAMSLHLMWFIAGSQNEKLYKKLEAEFRQRTAVCFFLILVPSSSSTGSLWASAASYRV